MQCNGTIHDVHFDYVMRLKSLPRITFDNVKWNRVCVVAQAAYVTSRRTCAARPSVQCECEGATVRATYEQRREQRASRVWSGSTRFAGGFSLHALPVDVGGVGTWHLAGPERGPSDGSRPIAPLSFGALIPFTPSLPLSVRPCLLAWFEMETHSCAF